MILMKRHIHDKERSINPNIPTQRTKKKKKMRDGDIQGGIINISIHITKHVHCDVTEGVINRMKIQVCHSH